MRARVDGLLLLEARVAALQRLAALFEDFRLRASRSQFGSYLCVAFFLLPVFLLRVFQGCAPVSQFARLDFESMNYIPLLLNLLLVLLAHVQEVFVSDAEIFDLQQFIKSFFTVCRGAVEIQR